mmetsp:Transcript_65284/g.132672  ORF Transcript_65284/g.132672 Transcript_65284/m.132672 type:complete len:220 (+) Transcript_65284:140-799(+)
MACVASDTLNRGSYKVTCSEGCDQQLQLFSAASLSLTGLGRVCNRSVTAPYLAKRVPVLLQIAVRAQLFRLDLLLGLIFCQAHRLNSLSVLLRLDLDVWHHKNDKDGEQSHEAVRRKQHRCQGERLAFLVKLHLARWHEKQRLRYLHQLVGLGAHKVRNCGMPACRVQAQFGVQVAEHMRLEHVPSTRQVCNGETAIAVAKYLEQLPILCVYVHGCTGR